MSGWPQRDAEDAEHARRHQEKLVESLQKENEELRQDLVEMAVDLTRAKQADNLQGLRSLATTYVTARRNGHPDAPKHLEALLKMLGV